MGQPTKPDLEAAVREAERRWTEKGVPPFFISFLRQGFLEGSAWMLDELNRVMAEARADANQGRVN